MCIEGSINSLFCKDIRQHLHQDREVLSLIVGGKDNRVFVAFGRHDCEEFKSERCSGGDL